MKIICKYLKRALLLKLFCLSFQLPIFCKKKKKNSKEREIINKLLHGWEFPRVSTVQKIIHCFMLFAVVPFINVFFPISHCLTTLKFNSQRDVKIMKERFDVELEQCFQYIYNILFVIRKVFQALHFRTGIFFISFEVL